MLWVTHGTEVAQIWVDLKFQTSRETLIVDESSARKDALKEVISEIPVDTVGVLSQPTEMAVIFAKNLVVDVVDLLK